MKIILQIFVMLFFTNSFAQPFVLSCNLNTEYIRDKVVEKQNTGVWCQSCAVAITVERKNVLQLDNVEPEFGYFYNTNNKVDLDSNGYGRVGTWSIDETAIKAHNRFYERHKDVGFISLSINRLTGRFFATSIRINPIGKGNIESTLSGTCKSQKAAF